MGSRRVEFHPRAAYEAREAFERYWAANPSVGDAFERELERAVSTIRQAPERYAKYLRGTRRYLMHRFPYLIVYRIDDDGDIFIIAVAHGSRRPAYWKSRRG